MKIPKTKNELITMNNSIRTKHKKLGSKLSDLTDTELLIWIAGQTWVHGRSFEKSMENAHFQMENRKQAEQRFSTKSIGF